MKKNLLLTFLVLFAVSCSNFPSSNTLSSDYSEPKKDEYSSLSDIVHREELPSYYNEHLRSKLFTLDKINEQNRIAFSFSFVTDLHWELNERNSPNLLKYVSSYINIDKTVLGGDYITYTYEDANEAKKIITECADAFSFGNVAGVVGNHDSNIDSHKNTPRIPDNEIFNLINKSASPVPYSFELNNENRICSLYLNSGLGYFDEEQKDFIFDTLKKLDNSWFVVIFVHILFDGSYEKNNKSVIEPTGQVILDYFSSIKASLSCNFIGIFSGHSHLDYLNTKDYCFPVVTTMCDALKYYNHDYNIYLREKGTYTEQAFDIVQIDVENRKAFLTRMGAGVDRTFNF